MNYPLDEELVGKLLVTMPNTKHELFTRSVLLVASNWPTGSETIVINKPQPNISVSQVMRNSGVDYHGPECVYWGGISDHSKVQFLHTLDWQCFGTRPISSSLGITSEINILAAIAGGDGPAHWRCISGHSIGAAGELEKQQNGDHPYEDPRFRYLTIPATPSSVFAYRGDEQWLESIKEAGRREVSNWF
jgi:putative AlgH/UPF0301 family transcriptional regulator